MADSLMQEVEDAIDVKTEFTPDEPTQTPAEPELLDEAPQTATQVIKYPIADAAIDELAERYMPLTIKGVDDKQGFKACDAARKDVKKIRSTVEATRKELKADALEYGRKVDAEAKRLKELLEPIELHLTHQVDTIKAEKARIEREWLDKRIEALQPVAQVMPDESFLKKLTDTEFATLLANETEAHDARVKAEEERLAREKAEREELERLREAESKRQTEEAERLKAEREELERQKAELEAQQREIREQKEAAERAERERIEAEERKKLEAESAQKERERLEREAAEAEIEAKRQAALRPDREKLASVADAVLAIDVPDVSSELQPLHDEIFNALTGLADWIRSRTTAE